MSDMNDLKLQGRVVRDAVVKKTKNGSLIALFSLAVNRTKKNPDGTYFNEANYFPVSAFVKSEKFAARLKKGQPLILEGYLKRITKETGTAENGKKIFDSKIYICVSKIHLIFPGKKDESGDLESEREIIENCAIEDESFPEDVFIDDEADIF